MQEFETQLKHKLTILALGAESSGNFSICKNGKIYFSEDFSDLQEVTNFQGYKRELNKYLKEHEIEPDVILSDLHPLFLTTQLAKDLAKKYKARHILVQHHIAHIFSTVGENTLETESCELEADFFGIACDGTGYAEDETIWGGEVFKIYNLQLPISNKIKNSKLQIKRMGHLEHQFLIGGELAIKEPARVLISILSKFLSKENTYHHLKKHYKKNEFELLWNQLQQNFNCLETSSTARILDAVSVLLGFSKNEMLSKHGPVKLLEQNSTNTYTNLKPTIEFDKEQRMLILKTTPLFKYLIKNINKDKKRLAATAQKYIADGLLEICHQSSVISHQNSNIENRLSLLTHNRLPVFFSGGMANNKIISQLLEKEGVYINRKIPRGDAGISFGQIFFFLLANPRD
ncbi:MAG: hypothetical protein ACD_5C00127G0008 [uncultured bacterium]|nr:MAG: hypothetical protein ACD_5C00127G0008 [uncultured bacterium]